MALETKKIINNDKSLIQQEDIAIVNMYAPSIKSSKYVNQILADLKVETESNKIIVAAIRNRNKKHQNQKGKNKTLCVDDIILYIEDSKESKKKNHQN